MKKAAKNKAVKIGGIALLLWFLLRKAGSSAPIPGSEYGGSSLPQNTQTWVGMGKPVRVFWNGGSGKLYGYMKAGSNIKDFEDGAPLNITVKQGQFIGYVQYFDLPKGWLKVQIQGTNALRFYPYNFSKGAVNIVTARI